MLQPVLNCEKIDQKYPDHQISLVENDNPEWSDGELVIDGYCSGIWVDDYTYYGKEQSYLEYIIERIDEYLDEKKKGGKHDEKTEEENTR